MSLLIQLILIFTFFTTHGLTLTIEKHESNNREEVPGKSLQVLFGPIIISSILAIDVLALLTGALISKLTKDKGDIKYHFYENENTQHNRSVYNRSVYNRSPRTTIATNYVLGRKDKQTVTIQLPNTNTITKSINRPTIQVPTALHTNSTRTIQNQTSNDNSTRTIQNQTSNDNPIRTIQNQMPSTSRTTRTQTSSNNSNIYVNNNNINIYNKSNNSNITIQGSLSRINSTKTDPKMKPGQYPAPYSYI